MGLEESLRLLGAATNQDQKAESPFSLGKISVQVLVDAIDAMKSDLADAKISDNSETHTKHRSAIHDARLSAESQRIDMNAEGRRLSKEMPEDS